MSVTPAELSHTEFIGRIGHELRTPLNAILGFSMLLARGDNLTERQREGLATIEASGRRLLADINRLLELAEIAPGRYADAPAEPETNVSAEAREATDAAVARRRSVVRLQPGSPAPVVLVVDDTPANVELLCELLERQGWQALVGENGNVGIALAQRFQPDLILLDVQMRGLGGFETCGVLKADPRTREIPVIFTTVISDTAAKVAAFEAGAADYITKPFHVDEVRARIHTQLKLVQAQKELARQNTRLQQEVRVRQRAEDEVRRLNGELEARVSQRTAQLEAANRELRAFCHSMAHDLRGPLGAIDGFSCLLEEQLGDADAGARRFLSRIRAGIRQMDALTEALLNLAHLSMQELAGRTVDLGELASEALRKRMEREPRPQARIELQPRLHAEGDPALLRHVLDQLVDNAWKFSGGQPEPRIEIGRQGDADDQPVFYVRDNGVGFDMAYADKLFKPFQRLHTPAEFPGLGIGLAIVERIVARHGGRVWAEAAPGQGAAIYFTLPRAPGPEPEPA